jgi:hypothetical protein
VEAVRAEVDRGEHDPLVGGAQVMRGGHVPIMPGGVRSFDASPAGRLYDLRP